MYLKIKKNSHPTPFTSRDVLKSPFLQKRIKKNVNKRSYVLKNKKKTLTPTPFTSRDVPKSPFLQKRIKKNVNKRSYVFKNKKKPSPHPIYLQRCSEKPDSTKKNKKEC
jgi:hypothetical protein